MNDTIRFFLIGDINPDSVNGLIHAMSQIQSGMKCFEVNISSPGGLTIAGITMYNLLKQCPIPVHTHNLGDVSSAAILPFLAGKTRTADPFFRFMFHQSAIGAEGVMPYSIIEEKKTMFESDLKLYSAIIEKELPSLKQKERIMDILTGKTVILSNTKECEELGLLTPKAVATSKAIAKPEVNINSASVPVTLMGNYTGKK